MAGPLHLLSDELDRTGLLFAPGVELLPVSTHSCHLAEMVQEAGSDNSTPADDNAAKVGQALALYRANL